MAEKSPLIGIIGGQGRMGSLFADFFREHGLEVIISDLNTELTNIQVAQKADIVIISVPIPATKETIVTVAPHVRPEAALVDLTSVKAEPVANMLSSSKECEVIGLHPMFGNTNPIPGQTIVMCKGRGEKWYQWLQSFFISHGAKIEEMTAEEHDQMMTLVQGLVHFADIAFAHTLKDLKIPPDKFLRFASPPSELKVAFAARILAQDPTLYGAIQIYNDSNIKTFKTYLDNVQKLLNIDETKHLGAFTDYFEEGAKYLAEYKDRALKETSWIIDKVLENRRKHQITALQATPKVVEPKPGQIATLGPEFTYSDATVKNYQATPKPYYCRRIEEVFQLVENGKVEQGIVPVENSLNGTVRETIDSLLKYDVQIIKELHTPIHHCIAGLKTADFSHSTIVVSHPQALNQCAEFIKNSCPHVDLQNMPSTAAGMKHVIKEKDPSILAIGSKDAASALGLEILAESIEDQKNNQTNFIVIQKAGKKAANNSEKPATKTSIIFHFADGSKPGILVEVLQDLARRNITLSKIESRPSKKSLGDYYFYVDFVGDQTDPNIKEALKSIEDKVEMLKVLGSY